MRPIDFTTIRNHHEQAVYRAIVETAPQFPVVAHSPDLMLDVACVALNRLPARYIRHAADLAFFQTERERSAGELALSEAVEFAFGYVQARHAMKARA
jgi:hypothetical protein